MGKINSVPISELHTFKTRIDARTPLEFSADHIPGAINLPVLSNAQRVIVGTLHKQGDIFEAKRVGAAFVSRNIADHLEGGLANIPKQTPLLLYCWRGGLRSGSFVVWLRMIGWDAYQLSGGYKAFRRQVVSVLASRPLELQFQIISGATGCGKTRLLQALAQEGAQVLDLEALAAHRGSVLGHIPGLTQPSQKAFETQLWQQLEAFDPNRPVFVEAESRKIGRCHIPDVLMACMRKSPYIEIALPLKDRLGLLLEDYAHLGQDIPLLLYQLEKLRPLHSKEIFEHWRELARGQNLLGLFEHLITEHYDPLYRSAQARNFNTTQNIQTIQLPDLSTQTLKQLALNLQSY